MTEKATTPYPERTEDVFVLVNEPATEYGKPIAYQGTTITKALKDYYSFTTNREKVDVLKWIIAQPNFTELKRLSMIENKIFSLYTDQYDEILKTGETPNNLQIAQKFVANGYDVFLLSNPNATKSADFIIKQKNKVFYVEGKTSSGGSALSVRLSEGAKQANRIVVNLTGPISAQNLSTNIKHAFEHNENLQCMYIFKGARLIFVIRKDVFSKTFFHILLRLWSSKK